MTIQIVEKNKKQQQALVSLMILGMIEKARMPINKGFIQVKKNTAERIVDWTSRVKRRLFPLLRSVVAFFVRKRKVLRFHQRYLHTMDMKNSNCDQNTLFFLE